MPDRQPYVAPTLTRVVLQPTQAVLSACSTGTSYANDGTSGCRADGGGGFPGCKQGKTVGDLAGRS